MNKEIVNEGFKEINSFLSDIEKDIDNYKIENISKFYENHSLSVQEANKSYDDYQNERKKCLELYEERVEKERLKEEARIVKKVAKKERSSAFLNIIQFLFLCLPIVVCVTLAILVYYKLGTTNLFGYCCLVILFSYPSLLISICSLVYFFNDGDYKRIISIIIGIVYAIIFALLYIFMKDVYSFISNILNTLGAFWNVLIIIGVYIIYGVITYFIIDEYR